MLSLEKDGRTRGRQRLRSKKAVAEKDENAEGKQQHQRKTAALEEDGVLEEDNRAGRQQRQSKAPIKKGYAERRRFWRKVALEEGITRV